MPAATAPQPRPFVAWTGRSPLTGDPAGLYLKAERTRLSGARPVRSTPAAPLTGQTDRGGPTMADTQSTAQRFGKLVVCGEAVGIGSQRYVLVQCDCGSAQKAVRLGHLTSGRTRSCGCEKGRRSHGQGGHGGNGSPRTPEYTAWQSLRQRCLNPKNPQWKNYGGRGITVSAEWVSSFETFLRDMGPRPSLKHSIDRINNDGAYSRENCRWATQAEQRANQRKGCRWKPTSPRTYGD